MKYKFFRRVACLRESFFCYVIAVAEKVYRKRKFRKLGGKLLRRNESVLAETFSAVVVTEEKCILKLISAGVHNRAGDKSAADSVGISR